MPDLPDSTPLHNVGDPVHWRGKVYRISARYWRRSTDAFVYDLKEVVAAGRTASTQSKVLERELHKPSLYTLGLDGLHGRKG